jgi:hypothetical protein
MQSLTAWLVCRKVVQFFVLIAAMAKPVLCVQFVFQLDRM